MAVCLKQMSIKPDCGRSEMSATDVRPKGAAAALLLGGLAVAAWAFRDEIPHWTITGTTAHRERPLGAIGACTRSFHKGWAKIFTGDSNMNGSRLTSPSAAIPSLVARQFGIGALIRSVAQGCATVLDLESQLENAGAVEMVVMMFGTNDAAPRGRLSNKRPLDPQTFEVRMADQIRENREKSTHVLVLAPPPVRAVAMANKIAPYRKAARTAAWAGGAAFFDPATLPAFKGDESALQFDALHLNEAGRRTIADWLVKCITNFEEQRD